MKRDFVAFDEIGSRVTAAIREAEPLPAGAKPLVAMRNLYGRVRLCVRDAVRGDAAAEAALRALAGRLREALGAHAGSEDGEVLFVEDALLEDGRRTAREILPDVFLGERLVAGTDWWTVTAPRRQPGAARYTLYSVKGGVGRSTTAAVLAWESGAKRAARARRGPRSRIAGTLFGHSRARPPPGLRGVRLVR